MNFIIATILLVLVMLPLYILFHLSQVLPNSQVIGPSIGVLIVFTLAFLGVFYLLTSKAIRTCVWRTSANQVL